MSIFNVSTSSHASQAISAPSANPVDTSSEM